MGKREIASSQTPAKRRSGAKMEKNAYGAHRDTCDKLQIPGCSFQTLLSVMASHWHQWRANNAKPVRSQATLNYGEATRSKVGKFVPSRWREIRQSEIAESEAKQPNKESRRKC